LTVAAETRTAIAPMWTLYRRIISRYSGLFVEAFWCLFERRRVQIIDVLEKQTVTIGAATHLIS